jgi:hypothetical protein
MDNQKIVLPYFGTGEIIDRREVNGVTQYRCLFTPQAGHASTEFTLWYEGEIKTDLVILQPTDPADNPPKADAVGLEIKWTPTEKKKRIKKPIAQCPGCGKDIYIPSPRYTTKVAGLLWHTKCQDVDSVRTEKEN